MDADRGSVEAELLAQAERQTKALESINTYFMRFLAVLVLLALVLAIVLIANLS
jgi:hypothetical protein